MHYITEQRIVAPGYTLLQETVGQALTQEQERLTTILAHALSPADVANLQRLLDDAPGLYEITQLKRELSDFSASEHLHTLLAKKEKRRVLQKLTQIGGVERYKDELRQALTGT